nr:unnamed protein product [Callosobruchus analis]
MIFHVYRARRGYVPHKKAGDTTSVWHYFLKEAAGHPTAKCKICSAVLKTSYCSTRGLLMHLLTKHKIDLKQMRQSNAVILSQSTSKVYVPHHTKSLDSNSVWYYFLAEKVGYRSSRSLHATAKCTICSAILKTKDSSTKGLLAHLDRIHHIDLKAIRRMNFLSKWKPKLE